MTDYDESIDGGRPSDLTLIEASRGGCSDSFGELWRRHRRVGLAVAAGYSKVADPEDLVSEAFAKIYSTLLAGKGPTITFRGYLLTTIRSIAVNAAYRNDRTVTVTAEDLDELGQVDSAEDSAIRNLENKTMTSALKSLPPRWQRVLWFTSEKQLSQTEIARELGISVNAVSQLAYRAREGLREAWIQSHVKAISREPVCCWVTSRASGAVRGNLSRRDAAKLNAHLGDCHECSHVIAEAHQVNARLVRRVSVI